MAIEEFFARAATYLIMVTVQTEATLPSVPQVSAEVIIANLVTDWSVSSVLGQCAVACVASVPNGDRIPSVA